MDYGDFLLSKRIKAEPAGFDGPDNLGPKLFPWQRRIVRWALRLGRAALFEDCGLGKTAQQLVWADAVSRHTDRPVLILAPLAVGSQTVAEGEKFGVPVKLIGHAHEIERAGVHVTNYQKIVAGRFDGFLDTFSGVVLDESSILKSFMGTTKRMLIDAFAQTQYRLACTATPAPNDCMELGNHAEFLGVMPSNEMLARWFIADQAKCGSYRLKGHAEADFWEWVCSWAVCVSKPSDVGGDDAGFDLPALNWTQHTVAVDQTAGVTDGKFFRDDSLTATSIHKEMRLTAAGRAAEVAQLVNESDEAWVVWCNTNYEAEELVKRIPGAVEVRGAEKDETKERKLAAFAAGEKRVIISKPSICGFGLNWQHCRNVAFVGLSYSHEQLYQAVRRVWRFGQTRPVNCHVVIADTEGEVLATIKRKEADHQTMQAAMQQAMKGAGMEGTQTELRTIAHEAVSGKTWTMHLGDCVEVTRTLADSSVGLSVFSPPFAGLYIYSDALQDMGNSADDEEFFRHLGYLAPELLRVTIPGRIAAIHCKDLPRYCGRDGTAGLKDFPGEIIRLFSSHGWSYHSRVTIWKCPVVERERTNNHGLLHKTVKRDSSAVRQGMADFMIMFRRPPSDGGLVSEAPVPHPEGMSDYAGSSDPREVPAHPSPFARKPSSDPALAIWQRYAEPVWWDIDQMDTLNERLARESRDERHICPLQLDVVRRCLHLWSNPGDVVFSPFAGIGSEGYVALLEKRRFVGVELKRAYFGHACKHLAQAERSSADRGLFDTEESAA